MIISRLLFPKDDICAVSDLYFKGTDYQIRDNQILLKKGEFVNSCTYFNSISVEKWREYTEVDVIKINLQISGEYCLSIINLDLLDEKLIKKIVVEEKLIGNCSKEIDICSYSGIIYWEIEAITDVVITGGFYEINPDKYNNVKIAVGICTYKREQFVTANIERLRQYFENNPELSSRVEVFITDNGGTLSKEINEISNFHLFYNKNYGGASGFTRCMIEAKKQGDFTHFLFLDDDITLDPNAIGKLYSLLVALVPHYCNCTIGGAMLSLTKPFIQFENGAKWANNGFIFNNRNLDLRETKSIIINEKKQDINYNAWCFCCIPFDVITDSNLPLPIFFHMDDVEYGLRNKMPVITMNGINVWHLFNRLINNPKNDYYDVRNRLIMMSEIKPDEVKKLVDSYLKSFSKEILKYHYARAHNAFLGMLDYLRGFDNFIKIDPIKKHSSLVSDVVWGEMSEDQCAHFSIPDHYSNEEIEQMLRRIYLRSEKKGINCVYYNNSIEDSRYYSNVMVINPDEKKCTTYIKNMKLHYKCLSLLKKIRRILNKGIDSVVNEYTNRLGEVQSLSFWQDYLGIDNYSRRKKILMVASDNDNTSGAFRSMTVLSSYLSKIYDYDVTVLLPFMGDGIKLLRQFGIKYVIIESEDWIVKLSDNEIEKKKEKMKINNNAKKKIKLLLEKENIDLVHVNTSYSYVAVEPALELKIPVVWHIREFLEEDQKRMIVDKEYGYNLMSKANVMVAISDSIFEKYHKLIPNQIIKRIYNGIEPEGLFNNHILFKSTVVTIVCVGAISEYKGQHRILESTIALIKKGYDLKLIFIGNNVGQYAKELAKKVDDSKMNDKISFVGRKDNINDYYASADISCTCSNSEAFGRTTVESMMSGCLTVGSNSGGTKEIITHMETGILFELDCESDLTDKLEYIFNHKEDMRKIASNGQKYVMSNFTALNNAEKIEELYLELLGE